MGRRVPDLLAAALRHARTRLTSPEKLGNAEVRNTPARSEPVRTQAHRARIPLDLQDRTRHEEQKQAPAQTVTKSGSLTH
jgi:hypothetical protein